MCIYSYAIDKCKSLINNFYTYIVPRKKILSLSLYIHQMDINQIN